MRFTKNPGRIAGLLYVLASIVGIFGLLYVPSKLIVDGNAAETARNIAASETLFRLGIAAHLIGEALFVFVALALYDLLKAVNHRNALCMLTLILVAIPIAFLNELNAIAALSWYMESISSPCLASLNAMHWLCCSSMCMGTGLTSPEYFGVFGCFRLDSWCTGRAFFPAFSGSR